MVKIESKIHGLYIYINLEKGLVANFKIKSKSLKHIGETIKGNYLLKPYLKGFDVQGAINSLSLFSNYWGTQGIFWAKD